jgi:TolA-binding protein
MPTTSEEDAAKQRAKTVLRNEKKRRQRDRKRVAKRARVEEQHPNLVTPISTSVLTPQGTATIAVSQSQVQQQEHQREQARLRKQLQRQNNTEAQVTTRQEQNRQRQNQTRQNETEQEVAAQQAQDRRQHRQRRVVVETVEDNEDEAVRDPVPSLHDVLHGIGQGDYEPNFELHEHPEMKKGTSEFSKDIFLDMENLFHCPHCHEMGPDTKKHRSHDECTTCFSSRKANNGIRKFSAANQMDPYGSVEGGYPHDLPKLSTIEQMLLAPVHATISCYRLPNGQNAYRGQVANLEQEHIEWVTSIPCSFDRLPACFLVRRENPTVPEGHRDFRCDREKVIANMQYRIRNNPQLYENTEVDFDALNQLPEGGDLTNRIPVVIEDVPMEDTDEEEKEEEREEEKQDDEVELGPEQGGASGMPDDELDMAQDYVPQPVETNMNVDDAIRTRYGDPTNPLPWPHVGDALNDYNTPGIQSAAFPHLFPNMDGDATFRDRPIAVSLSEATKHLLWYAVEQPDGSVFYPFAEDNRWMYWAQNTCERHQFISQKQVYIDKSPTHTSFSLDDLRDIVATNDQHRLHEIFGRMQMFSANITGSDAYFSKHRKELEGLMQARGMCTLWFTFSAADNYWEDLHQANRKDLSNLSITEKAKEKRKFVRDNPHIVDMFFYRRLQMMIKHFFGKGCLRAKWIWFRIEYQGRGCAHGHGCCRLESDPGLIDLGGKVLRGKEAQRKLAYSTVPVELPISFSEEERSEDTWAPLDDPRTEFAEEEKTELIRMVREGVEAHRKIVNYNDFLITTEHPRPPVDAESEERSDDTIF